MNSRRVNRCYCLFVLFVCLFLVHPFEAIPTGCQSRWYGGVGLAVLISTGERLRSTRAEAGGLFVCSFLDAPF